MGISDRNILDDFCINFSNIVEKYTEYIIVSGFVSISTGRARATEDIDMIIKRIDYITFRKIHDDLIKHDFRCRQGEDTNSLFHNYLNCNISLRYTYKDKFLPEMEMKFAKNTLDDYQLKTKRKIPITGLDVWFSSIEMNIAYKEEYLKSEKDLSDAKHLRIVFENEIDEDEVKKIKNRIKKVLLK